jgi:hypothetical protein
MRIRTTTVDTHTFKLRFLLKLVGRPLPPRRLIELDNGLERVADPAKQPDPCWLTRKQCSPTASLTSPRQM